MKTAMTNAEVAAAFVPTAPRWPQVGETVRYPLDAGKGWKIEAEISGQAGLALIGATAPHAPLKMGLAWFDRDQAIRRWGRKVEDRWESKLAIVVISDCERRKAFAVYHHDSKFYLLRFQPR